MSVPRSILLAALVAAAACSDDNGDGGSGPGPEGDVIVENNDFDPASLQVAPGTAVVWAWSSGGTTHNVTFDDGEASGNKSDGTYERTFPTRRHLPVPLHHPRQRHKRNAWIGHGRPHRAPGAMEEAGTAAAAATTATEPPPLPAW